MKVFTLTRQPNKETSKFTSATCVLNTIKVGFPTANHFIFDNASPYVDWPYRMKFAQQIGHWKFIEDVINNADDESLCFVDPDVIFYDNIQNDLASMNCLVAGRYCPKYWNPVEQCNEIDRLHTSVLYIADPKKLRDYLRVDTCANYSVSPYQGFFLWLEGKRYVYDTFANVFQCLKGLPNSWTAFGPAILDKYTHLISGSIIDYVASKWPDGNRLRELHKLAETEPDKLRGFWRENNQFYLNNLPR